ncbi:MAG: 50S ribosomal protein L10 [Chloroflexota bacterium]
MPTKEKIAEVQDLKERLERATIVVSTEFRGLTVKEIQAMRKTMKDAGLEMRVIKNTLFRIAAKDAGHPDVAKIAEGPTALAISYGDAIDAAKALTDYAKTAPAAFKLRLGYLEGSVITDVQLRDLTKIPPKPVLLAELLGLLESPLANFIALVEGPIQELHGLFESLLKELPGLIESRAKQLESNG